MRERERERKENRAFWKEKPVHCIVVVVVFFSNVLYTARQMYFKIRMQEKKFFFFCFNPHCDERCETSIGHLGGI